MASQTSARIGLDVGSTSVKLACLWQSDASDRLPSVATDSPAFRATSLVQGPDDGPTGVIVSEYRRALGNPFQAAFDLLCEFKQLLPAACKPVIRVTGSGARRVAEKLSVPLENEFKAIARGVALLHPEISTVFELGGENSKYLLLDCSASATNNGNRSYADILDYSMSNQCAAGTGSFLDQQASRLQYRVEEIGEIVCGTHTAARIAGRCSVFAKSDMIHAQQKGYSTAEVLKGLCEAVARNFKSNIVKGRKVVPKVALIGGVSQNAGVRQALQQAFHLAPEDLIVPELYAWLAAIGTASLAESDSRSFLSTDRHASPSVSHASKTEPPLSACEPLSLSNVLLLRDHPNASRTEPLPESSHDAIRAYLGIDIGSVSTNLALLDDSGRLLHGIYLRTVGRPIEVVHQGLQEVEALFGSRVRVCGVGTTGSGRELIGELVGADTINDEITAHKTGALYVHDCIVRQLSPSREGTPCVDTIFEIGGQDAKYISVDRGVVVDFAMNEACAAGTGSFLEEQAERLGISIKDEFARLAMSSASPARLGERCTVFMERDVNSAMQRGASIPDLAAGLAYSVALNYLNRVVRGRKVGNVIYFQGGTAYNDAVAAAFSQILGKRIIVPPHNGIIGAIGMALIAQEITGARLQNPRIHESSGCADSLTLADDSQTEPVSTFRGFNLKKTKFTSREFVCKACSNYCDMKEITIEGQRTYWGDKCSDKFRKHIRTGRKPIIPDLLAFRDQVLLDGYSDAEPPSSLPTSQRRVGIPQAMFFYDRFPFWQTYLRELGFSVVLSAPTDRYIASQGAELSVAEPCFPVQIAHGHVHALLTGTAERPPVDYVLLPNVMDMEAPESSIGSQLCPWNQTLPFVIRAAPSIEQHWEKILAPNVYFRLGKERVKRQLADYFMPFGATRAASDAAVDRAYLGQESFSQRLERAGSEALELLEKTGEPAILLVGRPYNIYDRSGNCDVPRKLRDLYGVNVLPLDFFPLDKTGIEEFHSNMYWNSGRRILSAARFARSNPNLHIIYITNFKCGPDSFIKHFLREVAPSPFLILQFDGHGNDAGYLTRCEAYLDSKGMFRCSSHARPRVA
jgi:predicted CoA-substrate-specific enzyme activase